MIFALPRHTNRCTGRVSIFITKFEYILEKELSWIRFARKSYSLVITVDRLLSSLRIMADCFESQLLCRKC